jgi:hypothetical protein
MAFNVKPLILTGLMAGLHKKSPHVRALGARK